MININLLRENIEDTFKNLESRGYLLDIKVYQGFEEMRKDVQTETEVLQGKRNQLSKEIGILKRRGEDVKDKMNRVNSVSEKLKSLEANLSKIQSSLLEFLLDIPNIPHKSVPIGLSEEDNIVIRQVGKIRTFDFDVSNHVDAGKTHGLDFDLGIKLSGSRFVAIKGEMARLYRAIGQFMLDIQTEEHGYQECYVPYLVNEESLVGTGQLPKFSEDLFATKRGADDSLYLIPTGEVPLTNFIRDEIVSEDSLPIKLTAYTPCFRSEAGSYGKDTKGMVRQHQFDKVEMVQVSHPEKSYDVLEEMTSHAENILKKLDLPYQVVSLCSADMGFGAAKTYDLEVWLPSQNKYREISSVSNCEDFQSRRLKGRFKDSDGKNKLVHTLNGSGLAVGRTLVAIIENYQQKNGDIKVPKVLVPYMNGKKLISVD